MLYPDLEHYLQTGKISSKDIDSALIKACRNGNLFVVRFIVEKLGVDLNSFMISRKIGNKLYTI